jgi:hypothetical protein
MRIKVFITNACWKDIKSFILRYEKELYENEFIVHNIHDDGSFGFYFCERPG